MKVEQWFAKVQLVCEKAQAPSGGSNVLLLVQKNTDNVEDEGIRVK